MCYFGGAAYILFDIHIDINLSMLEFQSTNISVRPFVMNILVKP